MKFLNLSITTLMLRFYLLMAVVIVAFFAGSPWLAFLALPIFMSALLGIQFNKGRSFIRKPKEARANISAQPQASH